MAVISSFRREPGKKNNKITDDFQQSSTTGTKVVAGCQLAH
jgi:hypothetical protein